MLISSVTVCVQTGLHCCPPVQRQLYDSRLKEVGGDTSQMRGWAPDPAAVAQLEQHMQQQAQQQAQQRLQMQSTGQLQQAPQHPQVQQQLQPAIDPPAAQAHAE